MTRGKEASPRPDPCVRPRQLPSIRGGVQKGNIAIIHHRYLEEIRGGWWIRISSLEYHRQLDSCCMNHVYERMGVHSREEQTWT